MEDLIRPEGMTDMQFAELRAAAEMDERLKIWHSTVFMAQGLIEAAEKAKDLHDYGDERVEQIANDIFKICLAHLSVMSVLNNDDG